MKDLALAIFGVVAAYLLFAFVLWEFNPGNHAPVVRFIEVVLGAFLSGILVAMRRDLI